MTFLPYSDELTATGWLTENEQSWLAFLQYLTTGLFLILLGAVCCNFWLFLIRQRRYKIQPLLVFYILAILICLARIHFSFWFIKCQLLNQLIG